ncbi:sensor histidine kinase [Paraburkholderia sp. DHOC27]|uniref:sensor histidine kinase n=1 Tax=Paraburkholderia sp. DHOC27 TaxID=2303330 RepID=UPI000E3DFFAC|nr:histidine kinase [Paraburkholderia sp. DHOC27]RFU44569.1 sensor histidine kinase [Paraburkholderia sp. DHOC27]
MSQQRIALGWLWREARILLVVTGVSTIFFNPLSGQTFVSNAIYAFCVTLCIQSLIEAGRYGFSSTLIQRPPPGQAVNNAITTTQRRWPGWAWMGPWLPISFILGYLGGQLLGDLLTGAHRAPFAFIEHMGTLLPVLAPAFALTLGCTYFFYVRGRLAATEARAQTALRTAAENQLKLLVSQLEPHMLFNTLANLRVLIAHDPPRAQAMLDHLNGFLRATLDASRADSHALAAEFARLGDYLELMQVRMGARLQGRLDLPDELSTLPVPPLLLQPLVENAIKHGLEPSVTGGQIEVAARREGPALILSVRDTGAGLDAIPADGTRFGLQQVRERLAALYGAAASLELTSPGDGRGGALATVRLPIATTAPLA